MLEFRRLEETAELGTQELDAIALVGVAAQPHPDEMNVVRHQAISRTKQSLTRRRMKHQLTKRSVETVAQPALLPMGNRHGPENHGIGLVELVFQPRQIVGEIRTRFSPGSVGSIEKFKAHGRILARTDVRGYWIFCSRRHESAQTSSKLLVNKAQCAGKIIGADSHPRLLPFRSRRRAVGANFPY